MTNDRGHPPRRNPPRKCKRPPQNNSIALLKRRRKSGSKDERKSYFDTLLVDALENIVRFSSEKPKHSDWKFYVKPEVALSLVKVGGALSQCAKQSFRKLQAEFSTVMVDRKGILVNGEGKDSRVKFAALLSAFGPNLTEVHMRRAIFPKLWKQSLVSNCSNVKRLVLSFETKKSTSVADVFSALSGKLEALELYVYSIEASEIDAIAEHCRGLHHLSLGCRVVKAPLTPVWAAIGDHLEGLRIETFHLRFEPSEVLHHCKKLRRLAFRDLPPCEMIEQLCCGYGPQLESLDLHFFRSSPEFLSRIIAACPNVAIDLGQVCMEDRTALMLAMGPRASSLSVRNYRRYVYDEDSLRRISQVCTNLETIWWTDRTIPAAACKTLFAYPKPRLVHVNVRCRGEETITAFLEGLAESVTTIETFEYNGIYLPIELLRKFVAANRMLRKVQLGSSNGAVCICCDVGVMAPFVPDEPDRLLSMNWPNIVKALVPTPKLSELDFSCCKKGGERFDDLVEVCYPARHRNISISVCGYQYT